MGSSHTGMCLAAFEGCVPTPSAPIFWLIFVIRSVSFQYRSIAAAPQLLMSSNTAASSGSSFSASSFFLHVIEAHILRVCNWVSSREHNLQYITKQHGRV